MAEYSVTSQVSEGEKCQGGCVVKVSSGRKTSCEVLDEIKFFMFIPILRIGGGERYGRYGHAIFNLPPLVSIFIPFHCVLQNLICLLFVGILSHFFTLLKSIYKYTMLTLCWGIASQSFIC